MEDMQVLNLLGELESELENSKKMPFSNNYIVNRNELVGLVLAIREALPPDLKEAEALLDQESRILQNANRYADSKVAEADAKARNTLEEAQETARRIVAEAQQKADALEQKSSQQASRTLEAAQRKADELVSQTAVMQRAEVSAAEILANARGEAQRIHLMNLDHCEDMLRRVEDKAMEIANVLRESRNQLLDSR